MGPLKILLVILGFLVVATLVFVAGSSLADYIAERSARQHSDPANAAAVVLPVYFLARFVICPIAAIAAGAATAWKISKSGLTV